VWASEPSGPSGRYGEEKNLTMSELDAIKEVFDIYLISKLVNPIFPFVRICVTVTSHDYKIYVLRMPWSEPQIVD
jgi:hypothetical protein